MKKFIKRAGYTILPIVILLFVVLLNRESVSHYVFKNVAQFYAGRAHIALDIGRISGNPFSETTVDSITIRPGKDNPQDYSFKADAITCTYNLWDLKEGYEFFLEGLSCSINTPEFRYDLRVTTSRNETEDEPGQFLVPAILPALYLHNGSVTILDSNWDAEIRGINSSLRSAEGARELQVEAKSFRLNQDGSTRIETDFTSLLRYANAKITLESLEMGEQEISAAGFIDLAQIEKRQTGFTADLTFAESRLNIAGSMDNQLINTHVRTDNFDISELQKRLGGAGWDISGKIRGDADLSYNLESKKDLSGSFVVGVLNGNLHGVDIESVSVAGSISNDIFKISNAEARTPENHISIKDVSVPMTLLLKADILPIIGQSQAQFNVDVGDMGTLLQLFGVLNGNLHGVDIESVSVAGSISNDIFKISNAEARTPENHISITDVTVPMTLLLKADILPIIRQSQAQFNVDVGDMGTLLQLFRIEESILPAVVRPDSVIMHGYLKNGTINFKDGRALTADSSLTIGEAIIPVPATVEEFESVPIDLTARFESSNIQGLAELFGGISATGQLAVDLRIEGSAKDPRGTVSLTGEHLEYKEWQLGFLALQGEFRVRQEKPGKIESLHFTLAELTQTNNSGTLALASPATASWQQDKFIVEAAFQLAGQSEVALKIEKKPEKEITAEITTRGLDSEGWLGSFIDNRYFFHGADIHTVFKGLPKNPQMQIEGTINEAGGTDVPFPLTGNFSLQYSSKGIEISEFTWKSHKRNQVTLTGRLPYDPMAQDPFLKGELSLEGKINFQSLEDIAVFLEPWWIAKGSIDLDMDVKGSWDQPQGHLLLRAENIVPPDKLRQYMGSSVGIACDIAGQGDSIVLKSASLESNVYSAKASGSWQHGISVRELLQNHKGELKGEVKADVTVKLKDLNFLRDTVSWLRRIEGDMQGELHVSGLVTNPSLEGSFFLKDGEISHTFSFPMLSAVNLQGDFDEHSITVKAMQLEVGGSPVNLSGSINKKNDTVAVDLHVDGKNVLLFRNNDMRMRGNVQLDVSGPLERLAVKGTTGLTGGYYTGNIDFLSRIGSSSAPISAGVGFLFSFSDPPLKNAVFDIKITTIEPFRIRNNLIRGVLRPELSLKGTGELPFLIGTVYIDPSRVILPSGRLQVQSGVLHFLAGKPDRPQLDLVAHSKVLGYDINVVTRGPLDDPVISLSSSPALPNDDLLLLLLTGQPPKDIAGGTKSRGTTNVMVYLGRDFLGKWLEDESSTNNESILDRFELDYGRGVSKSGEQTVEGTFRLSELKTGKRKVYYLSGEKDKYDAYNYGLKLVFRFE